MNEFKVTRYPNWSILLLHRYDFHATTRLPNGVCHAAQFARHDGNELQLSNASWNNDHAGLALRLEFGQCEIVCFSSVFGKSSDLGEGRKNLSKRHGRLFIQNST